MQNPKISVVIPIHKMDNWPFFLARCLESIYQQTFTEFEIILIKHSTMPVTSNLVIEAAKGDIIKVLYMDDFLASPNYLEEVYKAFQDKNVEWLITAASTNKEPRWTDDIETGNNKLGSPSALAFRRHYGDNELFDPALSWLLDVDLYKRMKNRFGEPVILKNVEVGIGVHPGQMTNILTDEEKLKEHVYVNKKYAK